MIYTLDVTTPANTAKIAPLETLIRLTRGLVYRVEIDFPAGAVGLHHVTIHDGGFQVWPSTNHQTFHQDAVSIGFDETYFKLSPPYEFLIRTYNLDDTFPHLVQVRIGLVSDERLWARFIPDLAQQREAEAQLTLVAELDEQQRVIFANPFPDGELLKALGE